MDKNETKKTRNRLSQRAFRRRQAEYIRELQDRLRSSQQLSSDRIIALEQENSRLRAYIAKIQSQLEGTLQRCIETCSDALEQQSSTCSQEATTNTVNEENVLGTDSPPSQADCTIASSIISTQASNLDNAELPLPNLSQDAMYAISEFRDRPIGTDVLDIPQLEGLSDLDLIGASSENPLRLQQIPDIWTFEYQMGSQPYTDAINACQPSAFLLTISLVESNLPFSDHIWTLRQILQAKVEGSMVADLKSYQTIFQFISTVLAMFNSVTRPDVLNWYAKTKFYHIVELTMLQLIPSRTTFSRLHERYQPTDIQMFMQGQYPCVIDWVPFASIRDRLIRLHAANPCLDQVFCDTVSAYVVEATLSDLVLESPPIKVYVRITDLVANMAHISSRGEAEIMTLRAPNIQSVFSPAYALPTFKHLRMDCGASNYKVDPAFFSKYPELCDPLDDIIAVGVPLKLATQWTLTRPDHLDSLTAETYCNFVNFSFGSIM